MAIPDAPQNLRTYKYATRFNLTENPISEGGKWLNGLADGLDWADVRTVNGNAHNCEVKNDDYNDGTAILVGTWTADQAARATVYLNDPTGSTPEVELRLRSTLSAHVNTGYEIYFSARNLYDAAIVRWDGLNDYHILSGHAVNITNGTVIEARISENTISVYVDGSFLFSATDEGTYGDPYSSGNPGIGFFTGGDGSDYLTYGLSDFQAWEL